MIVPERGGLRYDLALQQPPTQPGAAGSAQMQAMQQARMAQLQGQMPGPTPTATSTASLADKPNIYGLNDFTGSFADPSTLRFTPQDRTQPTTQVPGMNPLPDKNPEPYQILYDPSIPRDPVSTGMGMIEPSVVGPMLDQYRQNRGLGGANAGLGGPPPGQNFGGGFGGGFAGGFNQMQNRPIADIAAQTVGQTVSQAIQSRIPQMSQGIGSLIQQSLLSGGGQRPQQAFQSIF